jgi:peptidoglycan/LPS O-acetylase OafA/YrhL
MPLSTIATAAPASNVVVRRPLSSRIDQIDVLRGLSILAVIVHHINLRIPINKTPAGKLLPRAIVNDLGWNGYNGVIVFFAISGFLITTTCLRRWKSLGNIPIAGFYRLRFARIAPCLIAILVLLSVLHLLQVPNFTINPQRTSLARALLSAVTFHVNWLEAQRGYLPANWDVLWSLSNEEMFYLFFPLLCAFVKKRAALLSILLTFVFVGPFARTVFSHNEMWADNGYLSCMDAIAIGCLAAIVANTFLLKRGIRVALQAIGAALVAFITLFRAQVGQLGLYTCGLNVTLLALGTAILLLTFVQTGTTGSRISAPLRWFGRNSYEVYLTHMMVVFAVLPFVAVFDGTWRWAPLWYVLIVLLAGAIGAAVARYYSEPMNRKLRAHFDYKSAGHCS